MTDCGRYIMGWWPAKVVVILNIIVLLGYGMIDCVVAGQILSAVAGGSMSVVVGIIVVAIIAWLVTTFGYQIFHYYERWAWLPQIVVLCILAGVAGPQFNISSHSHGDENSDTIIGNRISFFGLSLAAGTNAHGPLVVRNMLTSQLLAYSHNVWWRRCRLLCVLSRARIVLDDLWHDSHRPNVQLLLCIHPGHWPRMRNVDQRRLGNSIRCLPGCTHC